MTVLRSSWYDTPRRGLTLFHRSNAVRLECCELLTKSKAPLRFGKAALTWALDNSGLASFGLKTTIRLNRSVQSPCRSTRTPRFTVIFEVRRYVSPAYKAE